MSEKSVKYLNFFLQDNFFIVLEKCDYTFPLHKYCASRLVLTFLYGQKTELITPIQINPILAANIHQ